MNKEELTEEKGLLSLIREILNHSYKINLRKVIFTVIFLFISVYCVLNGLIPINVVVHINAYAINLFMIVFISNILIKGLLSKEFIIALSQTSKDNSKYSWLKYIKLILLGDLLEVSLLMYFSFLILIFPDVYFGIFKLVFLFGFFHSFLTIWTYVYNIYTIQAMEARFLKEKADNRES